MERALSTMSNSRLKRPVRADEGSVFVYADYLANRQNQTKDRRRGEITRDKLKLSAVRILDKVSYRDIRVSDICKGAGVSPAAFYLYFKNRTDLTVHVLTEFLDALYAFEASSSGQANTTFDSIYYSNLIWLRACRANAGLVRCLLQLSDETQEFATIFQKFGHEYYQRIAKRTVERSHGAVSDATALLIAYTLGGMIDDLVRRLFIGKGKELQTLVSEVTPSEEAFAEFLTVLWYRALYCRDPAKLNHEASRGVCLMAKVDPDASSAVESTKGFV